MQTKFYSDDKVYDINTSTLLGETDWKDIFGDEGWIGKQKWSFYVTTNDNYFAVSATRFRKFPLLSLFSRRLGDVRYAFWKQSKTDCASMMEEHGLPHNIEVESA